MARVKGPAGVADPVAAGAAAVVVAAAGVVVAAAGVVVAPSGTGAMGLSCTSSAMPPRYADGASSVLDTMA
jgi:hypothetical protein